MATRNDSVERWRRVWQHAFFYTLLVLATVNPLVQRIESGRDALLPVVFIIALAGWYAWWVVRDRPGTVWSRPVYLAGAGVLLLALLAVDSSFLLLGLSVFAPFCLEHLRFGFGVIGLSVGGWIWLRAATTGTLHWPDLLVAVLIGGGSAATVGYVSSVVRVSGERQRLLDELRAAQVDLAEAQRQAGIAEERRRLAGDIHDTLTQSLASIVMLLEAAEAAAAESYPGRRHVQHALRAARESLAESRRVVWALREDEVEDASLPDALRRLAERLGEEVDLTAEAVVTGTPVPLDVTVRNALLRITQEALANVRRHAHASRVSVTLSYMDDEAVLDIQDDGHGFDRDAHGSSTSTTAGVGLANMRDRVESLGGTLRVETAPGQGTTVVAALPTAAGEADTARRGGVPSKAAP